MNSTCLTERQTSLLNLNLYVLNFIFIFFLPASVRFTNVIADDTFIYVSWNDDQPVSISGYRLKWGVEGQVQNGLQFLSVANSRTYSHTISALESGTLYRIGLYQVLPGGAENFQSSVIIRTNPGPPENVAIQDETASSFVVTWDPPSSGLYESFELSYGLAITTPIETTALPGADRSSVVTGLKSNTAYIVRLRTVYGSARSNAVDLSGTTVPTGTNQLYLTTVTTTSIAVGWLPSPIFSYSLRGSSGGTPTAGADSGMISDLFSGTEYTVTLGPGSLSSVTTHTVPLPTCEISLTRSTAHTLDFSWCPPEGTLWDSFDVTYSPSDGSLSQVDPTGLTVQLVDLVAAKEYTLSVVTVSGNQRSEPRTLSAFTAASSPGELSVVDCTTSAITVVWGESPVGSGYVVTAVPVQGGQLQAQTLPLGTDTYTFDNLTPGTLYRIALQITGTQIPTTQVEQYTSKFLIL